MDKAASRRPSTRTRLRIAANRKERGITHGIKPTRSITDADRGRAYVKPRLAKKEKTAQRKAACPPSEPKAACTEKAPREAAQGRGRRSYARQGSGKRPPCADQGRGRCHSAPAAAASPNNDPCARHRSSRSIRPHIIARRAPKSGLFALEGALSHGNRGLSPSS